MMAQNLHTSAGAMTVRNPVVSRYSQLELWDYYAGQALAGLLVSGSIADAHKVAAAAAYYADAMLIERLKPNQARVPRT